LLRTALQLHVTKLLFSTHGMYTLKDAENAYTVTTSISAVQNTI